MIIREFTKPGIAQTSSVCYIDRKPVSMMWKMSGDEILNPYSIDWCIPPVSTGRRFKSAKLAIAGFHQKVKSIEKKRWVETERSLSRRVFVFPSTSKPTKFWAVWTEGAVLSLQFGKVTPGRSMSFEYGRTIKRKDCATPEAATAAYTKLIAQKTKAKYKELWPRRIPSAKNPAGKAAASKARKKAHRV